MKRLSIFIVALMWFLILPDVNFADQFIADHTVSKEVTLRSIPQWAIEAAKNNLRIAYFHSSHGSRVISGMDGLLSYKDGDDLLYDFTENGIQVPGKLDIDNHDASGNDLSAKDDVQANGYTQWFNETVEYLDNSSHSHINVVMWSWCDPSPHDHQKYIDDMETLISRYGPGGTKIGTGPEHTKEIPVTFVFMTGHPNGDGESNNVTSAYHCHQLIRDHCIRNNRFCLDYWDIETHGMDDTYYPYADDDGEDYATSPPFRFYKTWQDNHLGEFFQLDYCAHCSSDQELTCNRVAYASWWLWARLAGWGDCIEAPSDLNAQADSANQQIVLSWTDNSTDTNEDSFIIQRQENGEAWINDFAAVAGNLTSYTDTDLSAGSYQYRVVAHLDDDGDGNPCDSGTSNVVAVQIENTEPPEAPTDLSAIPDSQNRQIDLSWTDNSTNESGFRIQRRRGNGDWITDYAEVDENVHEFTDAQLEPDEYTYRLLAFNGYGESAVTDSATAVILDLPEAPSGLTAQANTDNGTISLSWTNNADNETGYIIQRQVDDGAWDDLYDQTAADTYEYIDTNKGAGPLADGTYTYRVVAVNDNGQSNPSNEAEAVISTTDDTDSDGDGTPDSEDGCPADGDKTAPGACGCGTPDTDGDNDGTPDCNDQCPEDPDKTAPGACGCGTPETDSDNDGTPDCNDRCPEDPDKTAPGACGCGTPDTDSDNDGTPDCNDQCPDDPDKIDPGQCGCGVPETDSCNLSPRPPELIAPADTSSDTSLTPSLSAGDFQDPDSEDTHGQTIWQISTNRDFSEPVLNETSDAHLTAFIVPEPLTAETTYYWRVCYIDNRGAQSEWSDPFSFTTAAQDQLPDDSPEDEDGNNDGGSGSDGDSFPGCFIGVADRKR